MPRLAQYSRDVIPLLANPSTRPRFFPLLRIPPLSTEFLTDSRWVPQTLTFETAILAVPSTVVSREYNYILNRRHPEFIRIVFLSSEPFQFDARLSRASLKR